MQESLPGQMKETEFNIEILSHKDAVYRLARSLLSDSADAEDATQDVMLKLWSMRERLADVDNIRAFVFAVARNNCLDRLRNRKLRQGSKLENVPEMAGGDYRAPENSDLVPIIKEAIRALPEQQRTVMHLRDIEELEIDEIARIMELDESSVRSNLSRARKKVREKLIKIMDYGV